MGKHTLISFIGGTALLLVAGCASVPPNGPGGNMRISDTINLGHPRSEHAHNVSVEKAESVSFTYPEHNVMAVRASTYDDGHEPYTVVDGDDDTFWQVSSFPEEAIPDRQWIDLDMDSMIDLEEISIQWLGNHEYEFSVYATRRSDGWRHVLSTKSEGKAGELETYKLPNTVETRGVHIVFDFDEETGPRGIRKLRMGGQPWPDAYPLAVHPESPIESMKRPYYLRGQNLRGAGRFLSMLKWKQFNFKRPLADGGKARRIMNTGGFKGGHIDFDIAVDPTRQNWITLKLWACQPQPMQLNNSIALEAFIDTPDQNRRWFMPDFVSEKQNLNHVWYGKKPRPGRWVYAHYKLHKDVVREKNRVRLRLQGVGSDKRDHPMRNPVPPVYNIISHTNPSFNPENSD